MPDSFTRDPFNGGLHRRVVWDAVEEQCTPHPEIVNRNSLVGPHDLYSVMRWRSLVELDKKHGVPTDVFLFSREDCPNRYYTRIGGLPALPKGVRWPEYEQKPMHFLAQINFADSLDIIGSLPAGLVLIFVSGEDFWEEPAERVSAIWVKTEASLVEEVPPTTWSHVDCWGAIYRSFDYPVWYEKMMEGAWEATGCSLPDFLPCGPSFNGVKIGGCPTLIQNYALSAAPSFLFQVSCIIPNPETPYPFLDQESPLEYDDTASGIWHSSNKMEFSNGAGALFGFWDGEKLQFDVELY